MTAPGTTPAISRMSVWRIRATHMQTAAHLRLSPVRGCPWACHGSNTWSSDNGSGTRLVAAMTSSGATGVIRALGVTSTAGHSLGMPLASAISTQTMRPSWRDPGIPAPYGSSERLRLVPFKPLLGRRGDLDHLRPIDFGRNLLGLLLRQQLPEQL